MKLTTPPRMMPRVGAHMAIGCLCPRPATSLECARSAPLPGRPAQGELLVCYQGWDRRDHRGSDRHRCHPRDTLLVPGGSGGAGPPAGRSLPGPDDHVVVHHGGGHSVPGLLGVELARASRRRAARRPAASTATPRSRSCGRSSRPSSWSAFAVAGGVVLVKNEQTTSQRAGGAGHRPAVRLDVPRTPTASSHARAGAREGPADRVRHHVAPARRDPLLLRPPVPGQGRRRAGPHELHLRHADQGRHATC